MYFTLNAHLDVFCYTIHPVSSFKTHVSAACVPLSIAKCVLNVDESRRMRVKGSFSSPLNCPFVKECI